MGNIFEEEMFIRILQTILIEIFYKIKLTFQGIKDHDNNFKRNS